MKNEPFLLSPKGKDYLWGGNRLNDDFLKNIDMVPLAETWECSTHPDGISIIASGKNKGKLLSDLIKEHPDYLGTHPLSNKNGDLPILIKFIDANKNLSVQVHPSDDYARIFENGQLGKSEMWYILDAKKDATIVYGFNKDVTKEQIRNSIKDGSIEQYLKKIKVKKNELYYIDAGTVHAIGEGVLVVEIQESSNLTYRLYDYNRMDKNGKKRELHISKALDVLNFNKYSEPKQPMRVLKFYKGYCTDLLCRCKYFQVERLLINTEQCRELAEFQTEINSFQVFLCIDGCGMIFWDNSSFKFFKGDCIFIPANSVKFKLHGKSQLLKINC